MPRVVQVAASDRTTRHHLPPLAPPIKHEDQDGNDRGQGHDSQEESGIYTVAHNQLEQQLEEHGHDEDERVVHE